MNSIQKFQLLLWKIFLIKRSHPILTGMEIFLPLCLIVLVVVSTPPTGAVTKADSTTYDKEKFMYGINLRNFNTKELTFYYAPKNLVTTKLMESLNKSFVQYNVHLNLNLVGVKDELEILKASIEDYSTKKNALLGGVVFLTDFTTNTSVPKVLKYRIRLRNIFSTDKLITSYRLPGPAPFYNGYVYSQMSPFIFIQHAIAISYIQLASQRDSLFEDVEATVQRFPYPAYLLNKSSEAIRTSMPSVLIMCFVLNILLLINMLMQEKQSGVRELMKIMGLPNCIQWCGWFASGFIIMLFNSFVITILLCIPIIYSESLILYSDPILFLITLLLYVGSAIMFNFFVSTFFSKAGQAITAAVVITFVSHSIFSLWMEYYYWSSSLVVKLAFALIPNGAIFFSMYVIFGFELSGEGLLWSNLTHLSYVGDNIAMIHILLMMIVSCFLYGFLTWYVDNIHPGEYGIPKPCYFLFTKRYWFPSKISKLTSGPEDKNLQNLSGSFEEDPKNLTVGIAIQNLTKRFGWFERGTLAVDDISFSIYESQITFLLGHNGAGKSTTLAIISGMYRPTKGTVLVGGYNIQTNIVQARQSFGFCPQTNMLFWDLTVGEHLKFFSKLKGVSEKTLTNDIGMLLSKLKLKDKRNVATKKLSGGMMRKLHVAIALIGDSKIVILDEPSSGVDPQGRRDLWDLLQEMKNGRTILITTHSMEEADTLADRIAIMSNGKIQCYGSVMFLKNKYGTGYHLNISKTKQSKVEDITKLITSFIPTAKLENESEFEVSYLLPFIEKPKFPALFTELQKRLQSLGITHFGLSVSTLEEVFLKVGEQPLTGPIEAKLPVTQDPYKLNVGFSLQCQQFYALVLKQFYYSKQHWILTLFIILFPVICVMLIFIIQMASEAKSKQLVQPSLKIDMAPYGNTIVFYSTDADTLQTAYKDTFSKNTKLIKHQNLLNSMLEFSQHNLQKYRENCVIAAELSSNSTNRKLIVNALYSDFFLHSIPISLAYLHNALLHYHTNSSSWLIIVENAPLPSNPESSENVANKSELKESFTTIITTLILTALCLSYVTASFATLPILERTAKCKQLQFMTGVNSGLYWSSFFVWNFTIYLLSLCLVMLLIYLFDSNNWFTSRSGILVVFLLLLLYGMCSIPFTYFASYYFHLPITAVTVLTCINILLIIILSTVIFVLLSIKKFRIITKIIIWILYILPSFTVAFAIMKLSFIMQDNFMCNYSDQFLKKHCPTALSSSKIYPCCPQCRIDCVKTYDYFSWEFPGILREVIMLILFTFVYFVLLYVLDNHLFHDLFFSNFYIAFASASAEDNDVMEERQRIYQLLHAKQFDTDTLIIYELTKVYGILVVVDHLTFGVKNGECFGLLGVNGAGKTTAFRMMTGDIFPTSGNAYLHGVSLWNKNKYLQGIGYCPQFDALIDSLTGKQMLFLFGRLRGIPRKKIPKTVQDIVSFIGIEEYQNKKTGVYSGGNRRKLSLGIALIGQPGMMLLDEPTTGVDPVSRRKLWNTLMALKTLGVSIVLTSHSMEECEALCSRIGIMVKGKLLCLGTSQHLKNKYGQGFTVIAKLDSKLQEQNKEYQTNVQAFIEENFKKSSLKSSYQGMLQYYVADPSIPWAKRFKVMEEAKTHFQLDDYSINQATLEQVFLFFAH